MADLAADAVTAVFAPSAGLLILGSGELPQRDFVAPREDTSGRRGKRKTRVVGDESIHSSPCCRKPRVVDQVDIRGKCGCAKGVRED